MRVQHEKNIKGSGILLRKTSSMVLSSDKKFDSLYNFVMWKMLNSFFYLKGEIRTKDWNGHIETEVLTLCEFWGMKPTV